MGPDRAVDAAGQPSDPLNVGFVGTREEVFASMEKAGWVEAQALSRRSGAGIAADALLHRSDPDAPVEQPVLRWPAPGPRLRAAGGRLAATAAPRAPVAAGAASVDDRPTWLGATTFDRGVGLARGTGEITHVIAANIDAERDKLIGDLVRCRCAISVHRVRGVGPIPQRRHGRIYTDGMAAIAVLAPVAAAVSSR